MLCPLHIHGIVINEPSPSLADESHFEDIQSLQELKDSPK